MTNIQKQLFAWRDEKYGAFQSKLIPNIPPHTVIGVRVPLLRRYARQLPPVAAEAFLRELPHTYYEENLLHGFLIERCTDYDRCLSLLEAFLPCIDNWAVCDTCSPRVLGRDLPRLRACTERWLSSGRTYTVRYGIGMLMRYFLDDAFRPDVLEQVAAVRPVRPGDPKGPEEYYIRMMVAWFFATALAKQWEQTLPYLQENRLDAWTHHKTIRKAIESYRIPAERKVYLRTLSREADTVFYPKSGAKNEHEKL